MTLERVVVSNNAVVAGGPAGSGICRVPVQTGKAATFITLTHNDVTQFSGKND